MTKSTLYIFILFLALAKNADAQPVNLTIVVNEKLIRVPLICIVTFGSLKRERFFVNYVPGELLLDTIIWNKINNDSVKSICLSFYNVDKKPVEYSAELTVAQLKKEYLILNVYDFSEKKYKRWYQWITDKNYLVEIGCEGCGIYIKKK